MGFNVYTPMSGGKSKEEIVSFSPGGRIGISRLCYEKRFEAKNYVELYFDPENRRIGIKPLPEATRNTLKISAPKKGKRLAIGINCTGFYAVNDLKFKKLIRYKPEWDSENSMLIVNLG